uniref:Ring finger protein 212B n=1 Tax=Stegastes partitus TaxID=144197 RepID=A0A3B5BNA2_9TELE
MDWFHCNQCFTKRGSKFAVSSCGHICCEACIQSQCSVCGASCSYLAISDEMKPQEKVFFKDPMKLIQSRMQHITQIATFQQTQMERVIAHFKHKSIELERRLKEVTEQAYQLSELKRENADLKKQLSELKRETAELKKPLSQRRQVSPGQFHTETQRMTLPVAVTSPTPTSFSTPTTQTPNVLQLPFMSGLSVQSPRH